jgi:hypothetical protein
VGWIEQKIEEKLGELAAATVAEGEKTRTEMASALAQSVRGLRIDGARARPVSPNTLNVQTGGRLVGWSVRAVDNGGGGTVQINFRDGRADGDVIAVAAVLNVGQADTHAAMPAGVSFAEGLYVEVIATGTPAATVTGSAWIGAVD